MVKDPPAPRLPARSAFADEKPNPDVPRTLIPVAQTQRSAAEKAKAAADAAPKPFPVDKAEEARKSDEAEAERKAKEAEFAATVDAARYLEESKATSRRALEEARSDEAEERRRREAATDTGPRPPVESPHTAFTLLNENVSLLRPAKESDSGYIKPKDGELALTQVLVRMPDGTEKVVPESDLKLR